VTLPRAALDPALRRGRHLSALALIALTLSLPGACQHGDSRALAAGEQQLKQGMAQLSSPEGLASLRAAVKSFERAGSPGWQSEALYWLAIGERRAHRLAEAMAALHSALEARKKGAMAAQPDGFYSDFEAQLMLGEMETERGDFAAAEASLAAARRNATENGNRWNEWRSVDALAQLKGKRGQPEAARAAWAEARGIAAGQSLWAVGEVCKHWGDFEAAQGAAGEARARYSESLAAYRKATADIEKSAARAEREWLLERNRWAAAATLLASAQLEVAQHDDDAAAHACAEGLRLLAASVEDERSGRSSSREDPAQRRELRAQLTKLQAEIERRRKPQAASPQVRAAIRRVSERKVALQRWLLEQLQRDPGQLVSAARLVPELKDGKLIGLRVFGVRHDTLWGLLGIRNGDRLLTSTVSMCSRCQSRPRRSPA
jgi:hypothetical protein